MNSDLLAPITEEEVKAAAVQLGVWKAATVGAVTTGLRQEQRGLACGYVSWPGGGLPEVDMWHSVLALEGVALGGCWSLAIKFALNRNFIDIILETDLKILMDGVRG
ncbi:hypothetical protein L3X38_038011 [Prunus dulcis]|uniref:Uncharacterized protein n=1 Tax=Prunus dulcis TaxID=3755 RepID=A0AAD4V4T0_PRUDU|nr:hypothetical protein L3X38_038011 [Prunus dulcis]